MEILTSIRAGSLPTSGKAIASMILGISSIVIGCASYGLLSIITSPLAIVLASQAYKQVREGEVSASSRGLATAGLVTGIIGILPALIGLFVIFALIAAMMSEM